VVNAPKSAEPRQIDPPIRESLPAFHGRSRKNMKTFRFSLVLSGVAEITPALSDALYEATGGDIELSLRDGVALLEFERMASSLKQAIESAIREVEGASVGARVVRVESDAANVIAKINADLLGVTSI